MLCRLWFAMTTRWRPAMAAAVASNMLGTVSASTRMPRNSHFPGGVKTAALAGGAGLRSSGTARRAVTGRIRDG
jgi:hypothetical protein